MGGGQGSDGDLGCNAVSGASLNGSAPRSDPGASDDPWGPRMLVSGPQTQRKVWNPLPTLVGPRETWSRVTKGMCILVPSPRLTLRQGPRGYFCSGVCPVPSRCTANAPA